MKKYLRACCFAVMVAGFPLLVHAQDQGGYIGASFGTADDDILNETDSAYKLYGGFKFDRNIAGEIAFVDLGSYLGGFLDQYGLALDVVVSLPAADSFELFAKIGMFSWVVDTPLGTDDGVDLTYGFGAKFYIARNLSFRVEYEEFTDVSGGDVSLTSAGISYHF